MSMSDTMFSTLVSRRMQAKEPDVYYQLPEVFVSTDAFGTLDTGFKLLEHDRTYTMVIDAYVGHRDSQTIYCCQYTGDTKTSVFNSYRNQHGFGMSGSARVSGYGLLFHANDADFIYSDNGITASWSASNYRVRTVVTHGYGSDSYRIYTAFAWYADMENPKEASLEVKGVAFNNDMVTSNPVKSIIQGTIHDLAFYKRVWTETEAWEYIRKVER